LTLTVGTDRNCLQSCSVNSYLRKTRLKYWEALFKNPQFVGMLTSNLQKELNDTVEKMADYDFTEFNIRQVLEELQARLSQGVEDTIMALFDKLTCAHSLEYFSKNIHYYNGWKTNKAYKINGKVIIPTYGVFSQWPSKKRAFEVFTAYGILADIEKALNYLDGGATGEVDLNAVLEAASTGNQIVLATLNCIDTVHEIIKSLNLHKTRVFAFAAGLLQKIVKAIRHHCPFRHCPNQTIL